MVTIISNIYKTPTENLYEYMGLSTDEKEYNGIANGSLFYEMDTSAMYAFDKNSNEWLQVSSSGEGSGNTNGIIRQAITIEDGVITSGEIPDWLVNENNDYIFGNVYVDGIIEHMDPQTGQGNGEEEPILFRAGFNATNPDNIGIPIIATFFKIHTYPTGNSTAIIGLCQIVDPTNIVIGWRETSNSTDMTMGILKSGTVNIILYFEAEQAQSANNENGNSDNEGRIDD